MARKVHHGSNRHSGPIGAGKRKERVPTQRCTGRPSGVPSKHVFGSHPQRCLTRGQGEEEVNGSVVIFFKAVWGGGRPPYQTRFRLVGGRTTTCVNQCCNGLLFVGGGGPVQRAILPPPCPKRFARPSTHRLFFKEEPGGRGEGGRSEIRATD